MPWTKLIKTPCRNCTMPTASEVAEASSGSIWRCPICNWPWVVKTGGGLWRLDAPDP